MSSAPLILTSDVPVQIAYTESFLLRNLATAL